MGLLGATQKELGRVYGGNEIEPLGRSGGTGFEVIASNQQRGDVG
jgi:hypothetical protein